MNYYLDYDTRLKKYYIIPFTQKIEFKFMIEFTNRSDADDFLKKINAGLIKSPKEDIARYEESKSNTVEINHIKIFRFKK